MDTCGLVLPVDSYLDDQVLIIVLTHAGHYFNKGVLPAQFFSVLPKICRHAGDMPQNETGPRRFVVS